MPTTPHRISQLPPVPVRRIAAGHYETRDGRFTMTDCGWGAYRWSPDCAADWESEPIACALLGHGNLAWRTLDALRREIAQVYAHEWAERRPAPNALHDLVGS